LVRLKWHVGQSNQSYFPVKNQEAPMKATSIPEE
jgi:hypothetical protein